MKEFWNMIQMVWGIICRGGGLPDRRDVRGHRPEAVQQRGFQGHLPEGADLPSGGDCQHPGCLCHRHRFSAADGGDLFLYLQ